MTKQLYPSRVPFGTLTWQVYNASLLRFLSGLGTILDKLFEPFTLGAFLMLTHITILDAFKEDFMVHLHAFELSNGEFGLAL